MVSTSTPPYERLLSDGQQMSYQNTVVVCNDDDVYWLGNILNISGDYTFIHFRSTKVKPSWIHAGRVWPMPFARDFNEYIMLRGKQVFAALRDEDDGPFRFRPAVVTSLIRALQPDQCPIFYIKTEMCAAGNATSKARTEVVDKSQIIVQLPIEEPPLLCRVDGLMFRKLFIPFDRAEDVLSDASDRSRIIKHFRDTTKRDVRLATLSDCCRFHLRIKRDGCMFVVISLGANPETLQWMATSLSEMLLIHLASRADLLPIYRTDLNDNEKLPYEADVHGDQLNKGVTIANLPPFLMSEIFSFLELHSCAKVRRVCALWQQLMRSRRATEHIKICLETCSKESKSANFNCFKGASLLSRTVSSATKSLAIRQHFLEDLYLYSLLNSMQIKLPILVFEDYTFIEPNSLYLNQTRISGFPDFSGFLDKKFFVCFGATIWLTIYQDTSKCIVLHNWKLSNIFGLALTQSFNSRFHVHPLVPLPAHEVKWMKPPTQESEIHVLEIDKIQVTIPKLVLDCSNDLVSMVSRFMWALDNNFPPVAEEVYANVKNVHGRWVQTLAYPHEWQTIRAFLSAFSGFHADGTPRLWMEIDLRLLDVYKLSRMALLGIGELFRA